MSVTSGVKRKLVMKGLLRLFLTKRTFFENKAGIKFEYYPEE